MKTNRKFRIFAAGVVAAFILAGGAAGIMKAFAADAKKEMASFFKKDYPEEAVIAEGITPNVLFFVESDSAMLFAPGGIMPTENALYGKGTDKNAQAVRQYKANLQKNNTYGGGMRPVMFGSTSATDTGWAKENLLASQIVSMDNKWTLIQVQQGYSRFGKDIDRFNNIIGDPNSYYTPDDNKPYLLTFRHRLLAHHNWSGDIPPNWINNHGQSRDVAGAFDWEAEAARNSYDAIKDYMPPNGSKWKAKEPVPLDLANKHLVPNDSRMYKLKLALWRLFEQPGNDEKFSKINFGLAQPYKEYIIDKSTATWGATSTTYGSYVIKENGTVTDGSGKYRFAQHGEANYYGAFTASTTTPAVSSDYGGGAAFFYGFNPGWATSKGVNYVGGSLIDVSQTQMGQWIKYELPQWGLAASDNDPKPDSNTTTGIARIRESRSFSRAILTMPFDKLYTRNGANFDETPHLKKFKQYIDGIEAYSGTSADVNTVGSKPSFINNELFPISANYVASMVYGGRSGAPAVSPDTGTGMYHYNRQGGLSTNATKLANYLIQYATDTTAASGLQYNDDGRLYLDKMPIPDPKREHQTLNSGQVAGSMSDFFNPIVGTETKNGLVFAGNEGFFPVTGTCQQNWVVLFLGGNEALKDYSPSHYTTAQAVLKLFQNTLTMRGRVWSDDKWQPATFNMDSGVRTIVVGIVDKDNPDAGDMVKEIEDVATHGDPVKNSSGVWVKNDNAKAYFAKDVKGITEALDAIMRRISLGSSGGGAPVSLPDLEHTNNDGTRSVFGASYKIIRPEDQWEAWLQRTDIGLVDNAMTEKWQADKKLIVKSEDRKLYTWLHSGSGLKELKDLKSLWKDAGIPKGDDATKFRKWLYEFDTKNPPLDGSIGILGDMPRSNILVVGKPKASGGLLGGLIGNERAISVYAQTNRGVLHRFGYDDGEEKWGFIPPNIFEDRLKYMKFKESSGGLEWLGAAESQPMILLDGKLVARDVRFEHGVLGTEYRTILTGYLGRGGNGFYAMDITKADANAEPEFLWAIENKYYGSGDIKQQNVEGWGEAKSNNSDYDYSKLGLTIVPGVFITPEGNPDQDVGVLPGGLGHKLGKNGDTQGKAFYVSDPQDGKILNKMDKISGDAGDTLGMGVTPIVFRYGENLAGETILRKTRWFYTADSEGNILRCDTSDKDTAIEDWTLERVFKLATIAVHDAFENVTAGKPVAIPHAMSLVGLPGQLGQDEWLFGGTANIAGPGSDSLFSGDKTIINPQQFIFGLNLSNLDKWPMAQRTMVGILASRDYYSDGIKPEYPIPKKDYVFNENLKETNSNGWYLKLRPAVAGNASNPQGTDPEYVSAPPYLFNDSMYVATFVPYKGTGEDRTCQNIGWGKLYVLSPSTGRSTLKDRAAVEVDNVRIVGFSGTGNRLALSVQELKQGMIGKFVDDLKKVFGNSVVEGIKGIIEVEVPEKSLFPEGIRPNVPYIQYWREIFR